MKMLIFILMLGVWSVGVWASGNFGPVAPQTTPSCSAATASCRLP